MRSLASYRASRALGLWGVIASTWTLLQGCAVHEPGRYQVTHVEVTGQEQLAERPLLECLVTRERPRVSLTLGLGDPGCGEAPFDSQAPRLNLWRWWWTDWPAFNNAVFDEDQDRILRWYQARGYYDARIVEVKFDPPEAGDPTKEAPCDLENEVCPVRLVIKVEEGEPTLIEQVELLGHDQLASALREQLSAQVQLEQGTPIDESDYDAAEARLLKTLRHAGYAQAEVKGQVDVQTELHQARVKLELVPGEIFEFGQLSMEGQGGLPQKAIHAAAALPTGDRYDPESLDEVQAEVLALGAFSSVEVHEEIDAEARRVDVLLKLTPRPKHDLRLGVGVLSGAQQRTSTGEMASVPQWDVHAFSRYERRHLLGSLARMTVEERPRMIFQRGFPRLTVPKYGNWLMLRLIQPGWLEARTETFSENAWDYGPDPYLGFLRSDVYFRLGARRGFFRRRLMATLAVQQDLLMVGQGANNTTSDGSQLPSSYGYTFVEEDLRLDLRDDPGRPRIGTYFGLNATQAPRWAGSDWTAFRVGPEVRTYLPLFGDIVWANRFAVAGLFIRDASENLDATSQALGPSTYRLRGGGANSNRGFLAGSLGAGLSGGVRRWEASTEFRIPLGKSFVVAALMDAGDVNADPYWRFDHLNLAAGFGFRFYTILGAIRLDTALRIRSLQRLDGSDGIEDDDSDLFGAPGAIHLTIGDAF